MDKEKKKKGEEGKKTSSTFCQRGEGRGGTIIITFPRGAKKKKTQTPQKKKREGLRLFCSLLKGEKRERFPPSSLVRGKKGLFEARNASANEGGKEKEKKAESDVSAGWRREKSVTFPCFYAQEKKEGRIGFQEGRRKKNGGAHRACFRPEEGKKKKKKEATTLS